MERAFGSPQRSPGALLLQGGGQFLDKGGVLREQDGRPLGFRALPHGQLVDVANDSLGGGRNREEGAGPGRERYRLDISPREGGRSDQERDHPEAGKVGGTHEPGELPAVQARHVQVGDDHRGCGAVDQRLHDGASVRMGVDLRPRRLEKGGHGPQLGRVVVRDEDLVPREQMALVHG